MNKVFRAVFLLCVGKAVLSAPVYANPYGTSPQPVSPYYNDAAREPNQQRSPDYTSPRSQSMQPAQPSQVADGSGSNSLWDLYTQLEQLKREIQSLRGYIEQQEHRINILQQQQKDQYLDLDRRVGQLPAASSVADYTQVLQPGQSQTQPGSQQPGDWSTNEANFKDEKQRYQQANQLVQAKQLEQARDAFQQFIIDFPNGAFAANAYYWLGEVYMALNEPQFKEAEENFQIVLQRFPMHPKVGATLYKLGKLYHIQGNEAQAREMLQKAVDHQPGSTASKLAKRYMSQLP